MTRRVAALFAVVTLALAAQSQSPKPPAGKEKDEPTLAAVTGVVDKATADSLTVTARGTDGKFKGAVTYKLTGTSRVTTVSKQVRAGKPVMVQTDADFKALAAGQPVAVIAADGPDGAVLLTAVVQPAGK